MHFIPFNKPFIAGNELAYIKQSVESGKISGDGLFTKKCHDFFATRYGFANALLTTSCTDALEMAAILVDVKPNDEVIMPSYTFVSSANAFVLRGAKVILADSRPDHPGIDEDKLEALITPRTKVVVVVHYAGVACNMDKIMALANKHNLIVVEDAAQCIDSFYTGADGVRRPLGSIGHLAAFSFHETKNVISGEGGMLVVNDNNFLERAEIIREKGTNRSQFFRGEIDKYEWVDIGSSYLPTDIVAAFLYAQLENMDAIQIRRKAIWHRYMQTLLPLQVQGKIKLPYIPEYATNNGHIFYVLCANMDTRTGLIDYMKQNSVYAAFHYVSLHKSQFFAANNSVPNLPECDKYSDCLLRLPLFYDLSDAEIERVCDLVMGYYQEL